LITHEHDIAAATDRVINIRDGRVTEAPEVAAV
jgi:ABC-type lipoprotein export system ATPase subunit